MHYSEYPHRAAQQRMRALIWRLSDDLKVYRANPTALAGACNGRSR
jgi:hypothetical protein